MIYYFSFHFPILILSDSIFLTDLSWECVGGLPGLLLTLSDLGKNQIHIGGPRHTSHFVEAMRYFVRRSDFRVRVQDYLSSAHAQSAPPSPNQPAFEDENLTVFPIIIHTTSEPQFPVEYPIEAPESNPASRGFLSLDSSVDPQVHGRAEFEGYLTDKISSYDPEGCQDPSRDISSDRRDRLPRAFAAGRPSSSICCYAFHTPSVRGKFDPKKAMELGVKKGLAFSHLTRGESVITESGREVFPHEVISPEVPGHVVIVVKCPSEEYLPSLVNSPAWKNYQQQGVHAEQVVSLYHVSTPEIIASPTYQAWIDQFPSHVQVST